MRRRRLLVIGSGGRVFREYALSGMARRADLILVNGADVTWPAPYVVESHVADLADLDGLTRLAQGLGLDGVLTYDEAQVSTAAELAARLGLPHTDAAAIGRAKDKFALRKCLDAAGLSPVRHGIAYSAKQAREIATRVGYPLVCKPPALGGSVGVVRVDDARALDEAFSLANTVDYFGQTSLVAGVLIEEYLDGPEYSVESVVWEGRAHPLVVAEKELAFPPYFEELAHIVPAAPHPDLDDALRMVVEAHRALGLDRLVTHTEFKLTGQGPRIVEVNVRLGGGLIPRLGQLALGVDVAAAAADVAVGVPPDLCAGRQEAASILMVYPGHPIRFQALGLRHDPAGYPGLVDFARIQEPGTELRLPPDGFLSRLGYVIVTGATREECLARRSTVAADLVIEGARLGTR
ncbi:carboxylase [Streptosporangium violaceochromogenes]|nr:carboxylase [Streptosporangium violaceochromogenes]